MKPSLRFHYVVLLSCTLVLLTSDVLSAQEPKFQALFNGKNLQGWKGSDSLWSVSNGTIVGQTSNDDPIKANTFLIWQGGEVGDFEFRCKVRVEGNNSGVQYRSQLVDQQSLALKGYQADLHPKPDYMGMMYGEKTGRGIIATGGQRVVVPSSGKPNVIDQLTPLTGVDVGQWNELRIVAVGNRMIHQVNGVTTIDVTDNHPNASQSGLLGLQLHRGPAMKAEFRNLEYRKLVGAEAQAVLSSLIDSTKKKQNGVLPDGKQSWANRLNDRSWVTEDPVPQWIWTNKSKDGQRVWFRHSFELPKKVASATIYCSCDNKMELFINGQRVGKSDAWERPIHADVSNKIQPGKNVIAIAGQNQGGIAALVAKLSMELDGGEVRDVVTGSHWKLREKETSDWNGPTVDDSKWTAATTIRKLGGPPWGVPGGRSSNQQESLRIQDVFTLPGFAVEHIYTVPKDQGSWVSLTCDPKGRLYACDQGNSGLYRLTIRKSGEPLVEKVSVGSLESLSGAQGLEWAFDSLWFHRNGGNLIRVSDTDGDDILDSMETYPGGTGGGEHGNHAVLTTEDGTGLYLDGGNAAPLASHQVSRVPTWSEGLLLPRMWDANGHARGRMAPGGWITRLDPETKQQVVHSIGYRNQYDIALNRHGDLFTYDADMEWDLGLPWYRPTRICFAASGSDYGWRSGTGKWPTYYEDSLPPVVEIGPGSPTGLLSGAKAAFPSKYQDALYALDWTYGTMYAIHLIPDGAGYRGEAEPFVYASPLPLTDATIGDDGAMYFAVGGRGTDSSVYRVRYRGVASQDIPSSVNAEAARARKLRRELEAFHGIEHPEAIGTAWPLLASSDRFLRHAARIAVESQPVDSWSHRVASEPNAQARITASVALARMGTADHRQQLVSGLLDQSTDGLSDDQLLGMLRAYSLTLSELGKPTTEEREAIIEQLGPLLPSSNSDVNNELIRVLVYLRDKAVIGKTLDLIKNRQPQERPPWSDLAQRNSRYGAAINRVLESRPPSREMMYAFMLRNLREGWTLDQRREYFMFLNQAAKASGGASFAGYLTRIRDEALASCSDAERVALEDVTGEDFDPKPDFPITEPVGPGKKWSLQEVMAANRGKKNFERGRSLFFSAKCAACHRLQGLGGAIGPDLTSVRNKFDERYLAEAIVHPSNHISDQYGSSRVLTDEGKVLTGLVVEQADGDLLVYPIDENAKSVRVAADSVELVEESKISQMPEGLLDRLNRDEVRDLMAYILSGGDPDDRVYGR